MRRCSKCKQEKPTDGFGKNRTKADGYHTVCKSCCNLYQASRKEKRKLYLQQTKERRKEVSREYYLKNQQKRIEYNRKYQVDNKSKIQLWRKDYLQKNRGSINARAAKRRALKEMASPIWLTAEQLAEIRHKYVMCSEITRLTGVQYHVDHIHPLKGNNLCGLHVPWNLQIITAVENIRKANYL